MGRNGRAVLLLLVLAVSACSGELTIYCLSVGFGEATLVVGPTGRAMLVDGGPNGAGTSRVLPLLDSLQIHALDWVVATHYHADHIGGLDEVIAGLGRDSVRIAVLDRGLSYTTRTYDNYVAAAGSRRATIADGDTLDLGDGARAVCLAVNGDGILSPPFTDPPWSENDLSVALLVSWCDFQFLVAGDLSGTDGGGYRDIETSLAAELEPVEVYQVNHHASRYSSNAALLTAACPDVSVVSCGANSYGLPHPLTIERLQGISRVMVTADSLGRTVDGDVVITTNGVGYTVNGDSMRVKTALSQPREPAIESRQPAVAPNPASHSVVIDGRNGEVAVVDASGRVVRILADSGGRLAWNLTDDAGRRLRSGVYILRGAGSQPTALVIP